MLHGAITALITPFTNGQINFAQYEKLIRRQIANGVGAVVPVGTTGESATLSHSEHQACIEAAVSVCKGSAVKVVAGAGSNATSEAVSLAQFAQKAGADAILCVVPYYNKPSQEGLYQHFKAIAQSVEIGVMLYNVPGRCGVDLLPQTVFRLFDELPNVIAIKEASGSVDRATMLISNRSKLQVFSGDDAINFPITACGGSGAVSVTSNLLPDLVSQLVGGDMAAARELNNKLYAINRALFIESNPIPIKAAMYLSGLLDTLEYRLPLVPPSKATMSELETVLKNYTVKGF